MDSDPIVDKAAIRGLVEDWVIYRDAGDWDRFREVWHSDGWMTATWLQASATEFIETSRRLFDQGVQILHQLGGWTCDVVGHRAISQVKMTINQRASIDGVLVDVVCLGRFYDFMEKRKGRWGIVRRQPIYEQDRLDPVDPAAALHVEPEILARFPEGYRHLAYLQYKNGFDVKDDLPGTRGPAVERVYAEGRAWLSGSPSPWAE